MGDRAINTFTMGVSVRKNLRSIGKSSQETQAKGRDYPSVWKVRWHISYWKETDTTIWRCEHSDPFPRLPEYGSLEKESELFKRVYDLKQYLIKLEI